MTQDDLESGDDEVHRSTVCVGYMMLVIIVALVLGALWLVRTEIADARYISGDVNGDGMVTFEDAESILMYDVGLPPEPFCVAQCDVTYDGVCNVVDALVIMQRTAQGGVQ